MPLAAELNQTFRLGPVTLTVQVIAPNMFSIITTPVFGSPPIPPTGNSSGSGVLSNSVGAGISQLMNIINSPGYPSSYKVIAATTLVLQQNYFQSLYYSPGQTTWISSLITEASAQNPGFSGYIAQAHVILGS